MNTFGNVIGNSIVTAGSKQPQMGELFILKVYYQGVPTGGGFYFGTHQGTPVIGTLSEPYSGPNWWPQKDTPADKADSSDVWITVEDQIAEGHLVMNRLAGQGIDNATGKKWKLETFFDVFRIMDGRIVEFWHAHDSLALMKQLEE